MKNALKAVLHAKMTTNLIANLVIKDISILMAIKMDQVDGSTTMREPLRFTPTVLLGSNRLITLPLREECY